MKEIFVRLHNNFMQFDPFDHSQWKLWFYVPQCTTVSANWKKKQTQSESSRAGLISKVGYFNQFLCSSCLEKDNIKEIKRKKDLFVRFYSHLFTYLSLAFCGYLFLSIFYFITPLTFLFNRYNIYILSFIPFSVYP